MKKGDIILIGVLLFAILIGFFAYVFADRDGEYAKVTVDGKCFGTYDLNVDKKVTLSSTGGGVNVIVIENGSVYIEESNCHNQICVQHKPITSTGECIVCLPHKLVISICGKKTSDLDTISQ